ncbi:MAG: recombinase family protein [Planctomycetota bacterium]|jgi:DNA invertase Pin-like site-specific DNA recombinase
MKIISYYRVSTKKQGLSGLGLEAQRTAVEAFVRQHDATIIAEYKEVETGKKSDRPKLAEAIGHAKLARATLVVAKLDRLARNVAFTSALMESGVDFVACDNPHANRLTIHILAAVAEDEAMRISQRTKDAMAAAKARGVKLGSARPGHWDGREHLRGWKKGAAVSAKVRTQRANEAYAFLLPRLRELRAAGETYEAIAEWLNELGHQTTAGQPFTSATVYRIMQRADCMKPKRRKRLPVSLTAKMQRMRDAGRTCQEIATWLNDHGHTTGLGNAWSANSVHRKLNPRRKLTSVA